MENLIFSLNATIPIFLTMAAGTLFRKIGIVDEVFASKLNKFVFHAALPALLFEDLSSVSFSEVWDGRFVAFCFGITILSILILIICAVLWVKREDRGEFVQGSYRSSAALLGIAFIQNIYGNSGMAPLMIVASVPLYNIAAVLILSLMNPQLEKLDKKATIKACKDVCRNPIIWGIAAGVLWSASGIRLPVILTKCVHNIGVLATPLGLIAIGASFEGRKALSKIKSTMICAGIKLIGLAAMGVPVALVMGFREEKLIAILVMLGSATTVSSFIMAKNMNYEGTLTASVVMVTTFLSAITLTGWLYILKSFGYI